MSFAKDNALSKAKKFVNLLNLNNIVVSEAYLFGSYTQDCTNDNSDIDVAIISKDFTGIPFYDAKKISKYRRAVDLKLEVHSFSIEETSNDPTLFFSEIKSKGIKIT